MTSFWVKHKTAFFVMTILATGLTASLLVGGMMVVREYDAYQKKFQQYRSVRPGISKKEAHQFMSDFEVYRHYVSSELYKNAPADAASRRYGPIDGEVELFRLPVAGVGKMIPLLDMRVVAVTYDHEGQVFSVKVLD